MTTARLQERYRREIIPALKERLGKTNDLAVPRLQKIVISMGLGAGTRDNKLIDQADVVLVNERVVQGVRRHAGARRLAGRDSVCLRENRPIELPCIRSAAAGD